jgi:hypothetical protein
MQLGSLLRNAVSADCENEILSRNNDDGGLVHISWFCTDNIMTAMDGNGRRETKGVSGNGAISGGGSGIGGSVGISVAMTAAIVGAVVAMLGVAAVLQ